MIAQYSRYGNARVAVRSRRCYALPSPYTVDCPWQVGSIYGFTNYYRFKRGKVRLINPDKTVTMIVFRVELNVFSMLS